MLYSQSIAPSLSDVFINFPYLLDLLLTLASHAATYNNVLSHNLPLPSIPYLHRHHCAGSANLLSRNHLSISVVNELLRPYTDQLRW